MTRIERDKNKWRQLTGNDTEHDTKKDAFSDLFSRIFSCISFGFFQEITFRRIFLCVKTFSFFGISMSLL